MCAVPADGVSAGCPVYLNVWQSSGESLSLHAGFSGLHGRSWPITGAVLTTRDGVDDQVTTLTADGDDYLTEPFRLEELVLRG
jgi:CheY-like chemotaxis protein